MGASAFGLPLPGNLSASLLDKCLLHCVRDILPDFKKPTHPFGLDGAMVACLYALSDEGAPACLLAYRKTGQCCV